MGNTSGKKSTSPFTPEENRMLETAFRHASNATDKMSKERLVGSWDAIVEHRLAVSTATFLFQSDGPERHRAPYINLRRFAEAYLIVQRGTIDMKVKMIIGSLEVVDGDRFNMKELESYVLSVVKSYIRIESKNANSPITRWRDIKFVTSDRSMIALAKGILRSFSKTYSNAMDAEKLESWLQTTPIFLQLWRDVIVHLYSAPSGVQIHNTDPSLIPTLDDITMDAHYAPIIEIPHLMFINSNLPNELRQKWRFLFSSKIHGESFSTMIGKIMEMGATIIIIEDEDHYVFGGFAPESWALRPQFAGNGSSVLYTLSPAIRCFTASGYNTHYQYLNVHQQTMPNGLGMGGQFNYWGLWLDHQYGQGQSSESCTTYRDYVQLSKRKQFRIYNIEIWGAGEIPSTESDEEDAVGPSRSVLDKNMEDRVMLELSGRKMHSDGLREPSNEDR